MVKTINGTKYIENDEELEELFDCVEDIEPMINNVYCPMCMNKSLKALRSNSILGIEYQCLECGKQFWTNKEEESFEIRLYKFDKWIVSGHIALYENGKKIVGNSPKDFPKFLEEKIYINCGLSSLFG